MGQHEALLREAAAAGLDVRLENYRVVVEGPAEAESLAVYLIDHPHEVALELEYEALALVDERAAIMEHDGKLDRANAEWKALEGLMHHAGYLLGTTPGTAAYLLQCYLLTRDRKRRPA